jgi:hypothetical protein
MSRSTVLSLPNSLSVPWYRDHLMKWMARYSRPPCINYFRSATFCISHVISFLLKKLPLVRRLKVRNLHLMQVFPEMSIEHKSQRRLVCDWLLGIKPSVFLWDLKGNFGAAQQTKILDQKQCRINWFK